MFKPVAQLTINALIEQMKNKDPEAQDVYLSRLIQVLNWTSCESLETPALQYDIIQITTNEIVDLDLREALDDEETMLWEAWAIVDKRELRIVGYMVGVQSADYYGFAFNYDRESITRWVHAPNIIDAALTIFSVP